MATKVTYPFSFEAIPINETMLEQIGFYSYYENAWIKKIDLGSGFFVVAEHLEGTQGQKFFPHHYTAGPYLEKLYFLHELYEYVEKDMPAEALVNLNQKLERARMTYAINSFLAWRSNSKIFHRYETTFRI